MFRTLRLYSLGLVALLASSHVNQAAEHTMDSLTKVRTALDQKQAVLIDVREQDEWDEGHLQDAKLVPLSALPKLIDDEKIAKQLPKDKIIYCHCKAGGRVIKAADLLRAEGYDVRPLKQGYVDLLDAGFKQAPKK
jgi:rhodanese-related sulfurtransferase